MPLSSSALSSSAAALLMLCGLCVDENNELMGIIRMASARVPMYLSSIIFIYKVSKYQSTYVGVDGYSYLDVSYICRTTLCR